jgi:hypothetical protein
MWRHVDAAEDFQDDIVGERGGEIDRFRHGYHIL